MPRSTSNTPDRAAFAILAHVLPALAASAVGLLASSCAYDLDKLYTHQASDASVNPSDPADASEGELPAQLIDLYTSHPFVDDNCRACVVKSCSKENTSCREDAACASATRCFSESIDPDAHAACRSEQLDWFAADLDGRALGGPFYLCAFRDECKSECATTTDWGCLGEYSWSSTSAKSVSLDLHVFEARAGDLGSDITIKVCAAEDLTCQSPAVKNPSVTDENGDVKLTLPTPLRAFRGYLDLVGESWYPTLIHFSSPIARDSVQSIGIINDLNVRLSIAAAMVEPDDTRGLLQIRMFGCAGVGMRGVSFTASQADDKSRTWYYDGQTPQFDLKATTDFGNGGIINVPQGINQIVAKLGNKVVARTTVPVRAGHMTIVVLSPLENGSD
jgi:hypothetical protein